MSGSENTYPVRMRFEKTGLARYISHLDLMRCFERTLRRADIPFWFTEGFNPRPFLTFALPLSLGYSGLREAVDIKLTEDMSEDELERRLNTALPYGLRIIKASEPVHKPKDIMFSDYRIVFEGRDLSGALSDRLGADEIKALKKNKKKQLVELDIKRMIKGYSVSTSGNDTVLEITLASGCAETCNPALVYGPVLEAADMDEGIVDVTRRDILLEDDTSFE